MELRNRPELFGYEAALLLKDFSCTSYVELVIDDGVLLKYCSRTLRAKLVNHLANRACRSRLMLGHTGRLPCRLHLWQIRRLS